MCTAKLVRWSHDCDIFDISNTNQKLESYDKQAAAIQEKNRINFKN